jgi:hypothetical protein
MTDTQRELFEKAMRERLKDNPPSFKRYGKPAQDQYIVPDVQAAWVGFQAALAHSPQDGLMEVMNLLQIADCVLDGQHLEWSVPYRKFLDQHFPNAKLPPITNRKDE